MSRDSEQFRDEDDPEPMRATHFDLAAAEASGHEDSMQLTAAARAVLVEDEGRELLSVAEAAEKYDVDKTSLYRRVNKIRDTLKVLLAKDGLELTSVAVTPSFKALIHSVEANDFLAPLVERLAEKARRKAARAAAKNQRAKIREEKTPGKPVRSK